MTQARLFGYWYCTALYGVRGSRIAGPFPTEQAARDDLPRAKRAALDSSEPRFAFAAYGICNSPVDHGPGWFNEEIRL